MTNSCQLHNMCIRISCGNIPKFKGISNKENWWSTLVSELNQAPKNLTKHYYNTSVLDQINGDRQYLAYNSTERPQIRNRLLTF